MAISFYLPREGREGQLPLLASYRHTNSIMRLYPMTSSKPNFLLKAFPLGTTKLGDQGFNIRNFGRPKYSVPYTRVTFQGFGFIFIGLSWVRPMHLGQKKWVAYDSFTYILFWWHSSPGSYLEILGESSKQRAQDSETSTFAEVKATLNIIPLPHIFDRAS